ncbi:tRNA 2'-phosphotransferase 1-like [Thraustotheca clavata]|uniref:2'-phosphotransferase n=1 Tax=Thraustotheca clavata TaxID=74557 RepID=A0A1W0A782_9STRA|nr:tRNA 2'-phosphotransferase 1-like [Thraustotheca clavata]
MALNSNDVRLSKRLTYVLRHGAVKLKLPISSDGYIPLPCILSMRDFASLDISTLERIVANDSKQRFSLDQPSDDIRDWRIRANQGHSIAVVADTELLEPIQDGHGLTCIHGTYLRHWESIYHQGLCRMNRNHIHFAAGEVDENEVISGMRTSVQIKIYVDVARVLADGIPFYRSANNVLLCPGTGENGILDRKYFVKVVRVRDNAVLYAEE